VKLEQRRITPRMGLPIVTVLKGDAPYERSYHTEEGGLHPSSKTPMKKAQEVPAKKRNNTSRGGRPRASDRAVINGIWYVLWRGCQWKAVFIGIGLG
jgi:hypothetical protein